MSKSIIAMLNKYNEYIVKELELDADDVKKSFDKFFKDNKKEINKKEKKPKDKNAPKRAKNAYMFFCDETRPKLKKDGLDFKDTASKLGEMWGKLNDKQKKKFNDKAEEDKKRYEEEMVNYTPAEEENEDDKKSKKGKGEKRGKSGYQLFCAEMRPVIKNENPDIDFKEMNKELGSMWSKLNQSEKDQWNKQAKEGVDVEAKLPKKAVKKNSKKQEEEELEEEEDLEEENEDIEEEENDEEKEDYSKKSFKELKEIAKEKGIKGFSKMNKEDLIEAIENL